MTTQPRLLDGVRERLRSKHYSIRTEQAYVDWIKRFILYLPKALQVGRLRVKDVDFGYSQITPATARARKTGA